MSEWLWPLQKLINDGLEYDLASKDKVARLAGKTLVLETSEPNLAISVTIESDGFVFLESGKIEPFDALVAGKASDLFAVMKAEDRTAAMMAHQITIEGDTRTFFTIQEIMSHLDIDWEMAIGDKIGDTAAHVVADGIKLFGSILKNQLTSFERTSRNFFREESQLLVPSNLWQPHKDAIQTLRMDADRVAARIRKLAATLPEKSNEGKPQ
ncbi:SCP2 domain-containing protein [Reinekea sp.]|jgi:ubiquinone biosynthesis protein UbiJ|uniref:ubiquinone biosynthesis accessory factor UbiJ n=1 Tax=Reinekea sp. TaxID=1970455 RepID=UPI003988F332